MRDFLGNPLQSAFPQFDPGVLLLDDCDGTFAWVPTGTGGDDVHEYSTVAALHGAKGLRLKTRTTGAAANDNLTVTRKVAQPESKLLVMRVRVAVVDKTKLSSFWIGITERSAYYNYVYKFNWVVNAHQWEYWKGDGSWGAVGLGQCPEDDGVWIDMQLILDVGSKSYQAVVGNGQRVSMVGYGGQSLGATTRRQVDVAMGIITPVNSPGEVYVDLIYVGSHMDV